MQTAAWDGLERKALSHSAFMAQRNISIEAVFFSSIVPPTDEGGSGQRHQAAHGFKN